MGISVSVAAVTTIPEFSETTAAKTLFLLCYGVHYAVVALLHPSSHSRTWLRDQTRPGS